MTRPDREIIIIGGGPAGLSAALTLARARRSVSIIDNGELRNAPAVAAHGLLGLEGINPLEFLARGRDEVASFGGEIVHGKVVAVSPDPDRFAVHLADGNALAAGTLLIATGVTDEFPPIAGLRERWGHDVVHCPYCHGWEIRDQRIGLIATGPTSALHPPRLARPTPPRRDDREAAENEESLPHFCGRLSFTTAQGHSVHRFE
ncbi:NAD(P)/FAD-dependent oxidoreductase [Protaetiibacter intestinalis]|uniref:NAD(P)/FAD-dependent oxidoreductase n=1 Tax=Protaetiibacter intestinalis TaxID=2419774 RepID=A0A387BEB8_9MICO|nr:NAD(P)/FAD-dependent oxidoreductase [Protaetiibacter intestinalis]AYF99249.1 NAD(P)/FAD-dependent oxidoreductase [Protaetiibacter intestinalis]